MKKSLLLVLALLIALIPAGGVLAQKDKEPFCGDLPAEDCDLLKANRAAMNDLWSVTYDLGMNVDITIDEESMAFELVSGGAIAYDKAALDTIAEEVLDTTIGDILALLKEPEALIDTVADYTERGILAPEGEVNFELVLPAEATGGMAFPLDLSLKKIEGKVYASTFLLSFMGLEPDTWVEVDLLEILDQAVAAVKDPSFGEGMMSGFGPMRSDDEGRAPAIPPMDNGPGGDFFGQWQALMQKPYWKAMDSPEFQAKILKIERLEDAEVAGTAVAVFQTTVDFGAMVETEEFQMAFKDIMSFTMSAPEMEAEEMDAMAEAILEMLKDITLTSTKMIGLDDAFTYGYSFDYHQTFDVAAFVESMGEDTDEVDMGAQEYSFSVQNTLTNHNQELQLEVPENTVTLQELTEMTSSEMGD